MVSSITTTLAFAVVFSASGCSGSTHLVGMCYDFDKNSIDCVSLNTGCSCPSQSKQLYLFVSTCSEEDAIAKCQAKENLLSYVRCQHAEPGNRIITCRPYAFGCHTDFETMMPTDGIYTSKDKCENTQKYYFVKTGLAENDDFPRQHQFCQLKGGQLATVKSEEEWTNMTVALAPYNATSSTWTFWLGLSIVEGNWTWQDGDVYSVVVGGLAVIPTTTNQFCIIVDWDSGSGWHLDTFDCNVGSMGHVCESFTVE